MSMVRTLCERATVTARGRSEVTPARLTITLYDLVTGHGDGRASGLQGLDGPLPRRERQGMRATLSASGGDVSPPVWHMRRCASRRITGCKLRTL